jgi:hypothetical protein
MVGYFLITFTGTAIRAMIVYSLARRGEAGETYLDGSFKNSSARRHSSTAPESLRFKGCCSLGFGFFRQIRCLGDVMRAA